MCLMIDNQTPAAAVARFIHFNARSSLGGRINLAYRVDASGLPISKPPNYTTTHRSIYILYVLAINDLKNRPRSEGSDAALRGIPASILTSLLFAFVARKDLRAN